MSVQINAGALPIHTGFSNLSELLLKLAGAVLAPGYPSCSSCSSDPRAGGLKRAEGWWWCQPPRAGG